MFSPQGERKELPEGQEPSSLAGFALVTSAPLSKLESVLRRGIAKREGNPWGGRQVRHWAGCLGHGLVLCVSKRELQAGCLPWKGSMALRLPGPWELIAVWGESE